MDNKMYRRLTYGMLLILSLIVFVALLYMFNFVELLDRISETSIKIFLLLFFWLFIFIEIYIYYWLVLIIYALKKESEY